MCISSILIFWLQFLTLTEDVHNIKPAVELHYSFTDDPEYKKKVRR